MVVIRKKYLKNSLLVMVLILTWFYLLMGKVVCPWEHGVATADHEHAETADHGHAETDRVKDHTFKLSGFIPEKASECLYNRDYNSRLMRTVVISQPQTEKSLLGALTQFVAETRPVFQPFSDFSAGDSVDSRADPGKLYLQNQSFLC